jgi:hypothetical protein
LPRASVQSPERVCPSPRRLTRVGWPCWAGCLACDAWTMLLVGWVDVVAGRSRTPSTGGPR